MGQQTKYKKAKAQKGQGLSFSSFMKYLSKPFTKRNLQEKLFCGAGTEMSHIGEDLRGINRTRSFTKATQDKKIQKFGAKNLPHPHPNVRTTEGPSRNLETTAVNRKKPPLSPHMAVPSAASISGSAAVASHKKPPTLLTSASTKPFSESKAAASVDVMKAWTTVPQSASFTPGRDSPLSGGTTSAAESPETLYLAIHPQSRRKFIGSNRDSVPMSVSYAANSPTNAAYKYSSTPSPSPSVTEFKFRVSISPKSGVKFVPSSPDASSPGSLDYSPSVKSEFTSPSPTAKSDAAHSATNNYPEIRSTKWADDEADSLSPASPGFIKVVNKYVSVRRSAGSSLTQIRSESQSPISPSKLSPNYGSAVSPECISSSTNPSESVRVKRQKPSRRNSVDTAEEEQQSGLSILRSFPLTGARSNGSNFSPFMQGWTSEPDLLEYTSKPRSIAANDSRGNVSNLGTWHESGIYMSSPLSSTHESDKQVSISGLGDVKVEQVTNPSVTLASLWSLEAKQSSSSGADAGSASKQQLESFFTKLRRPLRSRSSLNIAEFDADGETATPQQINRQSFFRSPSMQLDRAKGFFNLFIKSKNGSDPLARSESSGSQLNEKTGGTRHSRRTNSIESQNKRRMSWSNSSSDIAKSKVALSRAGSLNSSRSKIALKFSIKDGEVRDSPLTPESNGSRPNETVTHYARRTNSSSVLDLLKSGRKSNAKRVDSRDTDYLTDSSAESPAELTDYLAELPNKSFSVADNPLYSPSLPENPRHVPTSAENPLYVPTPANHKAAGVTDNNNESSLGELASHQQPKTINNSSVVPRPNARVFSQNVSIPDCTGHATGLPPDLWQLVFCFLPRHQILGDLRIVCHEWQSAIDNSLFLPHMKQYQVLHSVQNKPSLSLSATKIERLLSESQLTTVVGLLHHLRCSPFMMAPDKLASSLRLKYLAQEKDSAMLEYWRNCIGTLDALSGEFEGDAWCLALLLILFVCEAPILQYLLNILLSGKAGACRSEAVEFLYLVLTAITAICWEDDRQPLLYELESAIGYTECVEGQRSLKEGFFWFTSQQHEILNTQLLPDQIMVIKAFPGTGKTSTLLEYANRRRRSKFAYIIFDRFVVTEGETSFPPNTKCINFYELAFKKVGWQYRHKLHSTNLSPVIVKATLGVPSHTAVCFILSTLEQFLQSADLTIKDCHIPEKAVVSDSRTEVPYYLGKAEDLWRMMIDKGSQEIPMTHQGYLKLYQLSESAPDNQYDCWLCDELQNATPVMVDIVLRQKGRSKILAGDPHQKVKGDSSVIHFNLTYSFRFGREIAWTCSYLLQLKGEKEALMGVKSTSKKYLSAIGNVHSDLSYTGKEQGSKMGQVVFVARSNAKVLEAALQGRRRKIGFIGGLKAYQFDLMRDTWHLMKGNHNRIQDSYIKSFSSYKHIIEVAEKTKDVELLARFKVIDAHQEDLPRKIEAVQAMDVGGDLATAEVLFSTAHKAKGLEFDVVALTSDYVEISRMKSLGGKLIVDDDSLQEGKREVDAQELNLLYVAASRAKSRLLLNDDVDNYLRLRARGLRRETRALLQHIEDSLSCTSCQKPCTSCLAIVAGRWSDSEDSSNSDPMSSDDSLQEGPSSSLGQIVERNQHRTNGSFKVCLCLHCARQLQRLPGPLANFAGGVKMIASVFNHLHLDRHDANIVNEVPT